MKRIPNLYDFEKSAWDLLDVLVNLNVTGYGGKFSHTKWVAQVLALQEGGVNYNEL